MIYADLRGKGRNRKFENLDPAARQVIYYSPRSDYRPTRIHQPRVFSPLRTTSLARECWRQTRVRLTKKVPNPGKKDRSTIVTGERGGSGVGKLRKLAISHSFALNTMIMIFLVLNPDVMYEGRSRGTERHLGFISRDIQAPCVLALRPTVPKCIF